MIFNYGKIIIDNRDNVQPFYDGLSMGCGEIHFDCSTCGHDVSEETLLFERANDEISREEKEDIKLFFNVKKNAYYNQTSSVGFMKCSHCNSEFALYISSGEVQMGRYQASLVAVVECLKENIIVNDIKNEIKRVKDYSNRDMLEIKNFKESEYDNFCSKITKNFQLESKEDKIIGNNEVFQAYVLNGCIIGIEFDIWTGLSIVAKNECAKELLNNIYSWLVEEKKSNVKLISNASFEKNSKQLDKDCLESLKLIEVVIDFNEMPSIQEEFILKLCNILNAGRVCGWDAFKDNYFDIFMKVPPKDYVYKDNDEWEWNDYYDYVECVREWNEIGPRNENGEKGDMKFIFKNFHKFSKTHRQITLDFLEIIYHNIDGQITPNCNVFSDLYYLIVEIDGVLMDSFDKWSSLLKNLKLRY